MIKPGDEPIPGYRVEQLLGRGQFGQVWRARSPGNTSVALKFLELSGTHGWKEFRAIQRVKQIRHAHLMPIVAIWLVDERGEVISDDAIESYAASHRESAETETLTAQQTLVAGAIDRSRQPALLVVATLLAHQSLGDRLRECVSEGLIGIPVEELLDYMDEAAKGLDYLNLSQHKIGDSVGAVQHCDVKPDNIMLTGGSVVICDFGVAQTLALVRQNATATSLGGTPAYMAPECFQNKPCTTSDQYSLAVTYYELRTGQLPFVEQTYAAVYRAHQEGTLDFSACKEPEQAVLRLATATAPEGRYHSCGELVEELRAAVQSASGPAPRRGARGRWIAVAAVGLVALAAAAVGGAIFLRPAVRTAPPKVELARVIITIDPPDALVTVDGEAAEVDSQGQVILEREAGQLLVVKASKPSERLDGELKIEVKADENEQRYPLELAYSADFFGGDAERRLADGDIEGAVAALTSAIKLDPDKYARLPEPVLRMAGENPIECLIVTPSGRAVASGSRDGSVQRWALDADAVGDLGEIVHQQTGAVTELAVADDWTASLSDGGDRIMLTGAGGRTDELTIAPELGQVRRIAITGDGGWLVAASDALEWDENLKLKGRTVSLHAWKLVRGDVASSYTLLFTSNDEDEPRLAAAHGEPWVMLATHADDSYVVRKCLVDSLEDLHAETPPIYEQSGEVLAMAVSADDRWIAVGGGPVSDDVELGDNQVTMIDAASGQLQQLRRAHLDSISAIAFDPAGRYLAAGDANGDAHGWAIPEGWSPGQPLDSEPVFMQPKRDAPRQPISAVACVRGNWVACSYQGKAALWNCKPGDPRAMWLTKATPPVTALVATPDGRWLVTGHEDGSIRFWPAAKLIMVQRACAAAGEEPRAAEATVDQVT